MTRMRLRASIIAIVTIIAVSVGGWAVSRTSQDSRASLSQGIDFLPPDGRVVGFTDWSRIREILGFDDDAGSAIDVADLTGTAFQRELSARSVLADGAELMDARFGWSVADLRWEIFSQATKGSVAVAGMEDDLDATAVTDRLDELGYTESGGVWSKDDLQSDLPGAPRSLASIAVLEGRRTLVMSESAGYLRKVLDGERDRDTLAGVPAARQTLAPLVGAPSVLLEAGKDACEASSLAGQSPEALTQARNALRPLGKLRTMDYSARAIYDAGGDQRMRFAMTFGSAAEASRQLAIRQELTTGAFVGRTGVVEDVLDLASARATGSTAVLGFDFNSERDSFMSVDGPVLFAACSV